MNYNLSKENKLERKRFVAYANKLLREECPNAELGNKSPRTINQNSYLHVLVRIMAYETGVPESYAKEMYLKRFACKDLFLSSVTDPLTNTESPHYKSTKELDHDEMRKAIDNFIRWAEFEGYVLPKAKPNEKGEYQFESDKDKEIYNKAVVEISKNEQYL